MRLIICQEYYGSLRKVPEDPHFQLIQSQAIEHFPLSPGHGARPGDDCPCCLHKVITEECPELPGLAHGNKLPMVQNTLVGAAPPGQ